MIKMFPIAAHCSKMLEAKAFILYNKTIGLYCAGKNYLLLNKFSYFTHWYIW